MLSRKLEPAINMWNTEMTSEDVNPSAYPSAYMHDISREEF